MNWNKLRAIIWKRRVEQVNESECKYLKPGETTCQMPNRYCNYPDCTTGLRKLISQEKAQKREEAKALWGITGLTIGILILLGLIELGVI